MVSLQGTTSQHPLVSDQINQAINVVALDQQLTNQSHRWSFGADFINCIDRAVSRQVQGMSSFDCERILRRLKIGIRYSSCSVKSAELACVRGQQNRSCKKWLTASWSDPVATLADAGGGKLAAFGSFCVPAAFPGLDL